METSRFGINGQGYRRGVIRRVLRLRWLQLAGVVSYGVYLWHLDILGELLNHGVVDHFVVWRTVWILAVGQLTDKRGN